MDHDERVEIEGDKERPELLDKLQRDLSMVSFWAEHGLKRLAAARIKEQAAIIQKSIEWKAKFDIAGIEARNAEIRETFAEIDKMIKSTGETLSKMMGAYVSSQGKDGISG